jgi:hypothetical protein
MNKKLKNIIINYYSIISIIILGLIYLYLELPENILVQRGGGNKNWDYPPNIPLMYKYRYGFVSVPILLLGVIGYYAYFNYVVVPKTNVWDIGHNFFSKFQQQYLIARTDPSIGVDRINYKYSIPPEMKKAQPDLYKFFNMIQLSGDDKSGMYIKAQYFCNSSRPCSCCLDDNYVKYFFPTCQSASNCATENYNTICNPK